jgi:predicted DNA-binding transcriptional regulator AlpA
MWEAGAGGVAWLDRRRLITRWRHGSDSFFWRAEADGLLRPLRRGRAAFYAWPDVFDFEGGQPRTGWQAAYRADLLLPEEVGAWIGRSRSWVLDAAKAGELPARRIGLQSRFVPREVAEWIAGWR